MRWERLLCSGCIRPIERFGDVLRIQFLAGYIVGTLEYRRSASIPLMAKPTLITDFEKDGSFTSGAGETSKSEREIRNGWREPKWTTM